MELVFSDFAKKELATMPQDMKSVSLLHLEKIHSRPPAAIGNMVFPVMVRK